MKLHITIEDLEKIAKEAKAASKKDKSLFSVEIEKGFASALPEKSDSLRVVANNKTLMFINF
jgi:hypothetical protein